jgi:predicted AAA+ superfamily ATPase
MRLWQDLSAEKAMVFLAGPRQGGKTTFAQMCATPYANSLYFNWDIAEHKAKLIHNPAFFTEMPRKDSSMPLIVFDEIHKYKHWKNYLKGVYDQFHHDYRFLVSGSGRLDVYQRGGDSLAGRYFLFHLWPLTLAELGGRQRPLDAFLEDPLQVAESQGEDLRIVWERLLAVSGFPEPYLAAKTTTWRRWSDTYGRQLIRQDVRDLVALNNVQGLETLLALLPSRVGSPLSMNGLAEDLKVAFNTVKSWMEVLDRFFLSFRLAPWTATITRAIQKERKSYLFNFPLIQDPGARFENAVAVELFRAVSNWNDAGLGPFSLHYVRNKEKQEVDFLLARHGKPILLVESKLSDTEPSPALLKFQTALKVPAVQLVNGGEEFKRFTRGSFPVLVAPAWRWLALLP